MEVVPNRVDFGLCEVGYSYDTDVYVANTGSLPVAVIGASAGSGLSGLVALTLAEVSRNPPLDLGIEKKLDYWDKLSRNLDTAVATFAHFAGAEVSRHVEYLEAVSWVSHSRASPAAASGIASENGDGVAVEGTADTAANGARGEFASAAASRQVDRVRVGDSVPVVFEHEGDVSVDPRLLMGSGGGGGDVGGGGGDGGDASASEGQGPLFTLPPGTTARLSLRLRASRPFLVDAPVAFRYSPIVDVDEAAAVSAPTSSVRLTCEAWRPLRFSLFSHDFGASPISGASALDAGGVEGHGGGAPHSATGDHAEVVLVVTNPSLRVQNLVLQDVR